MRPGTHSLALLLLLSCIACGTPSKGPKSIESTPEEAQAATDARNWTLAAERWYGIFAADMAHRPEACAMTAQAMLGMKDAQNASHVLDLGLRYFPTDPQLLELKGIALARLGFARAAADCLERVVELQPGRAPAWLELGRARARGADPQGALAAYAVGFGREPGTVPDLIEAAQQCALPAVKTSRNEYLELGLGWLERVTLREPQNALAHFELGVLCEELGRKPEAVEHYRRAIELDPASLISLRNLALLYSSLDDADHTREMVERALALEHDLGRRKALQQLLEKFTPPAPSAEQKPGG